MKQKFIKYLTIFFVGYFVVFVFMLIAGKFGGFSYREPMSMSWDELFSDNLEVLLIIPAIFGAMGVYIKRDEDKDK